jgi:hypothetical protein
MTMIGSDEAFSRRAGKTKGTASAWMPAAARYEVP